jgi:putative nucleotidyltransferase-like protein
VSSSTIADALLQCLRPAPSLPHLSDTQWRAMIDQAGRRSLLPLLFSRVGQVAPPQFREQLRAAYLTAAAKNLQMYAQLEEILSALNARRISVIILKGACLAQEIYGNIALRPMGDIDILGQTPDLPEIVAVLASLGYVSESQASLGEQCAVGAHLARFHRGGEFPIELHHTIEEPCWPYSIDAVGLWQRRRSMKIGAQQTSMLSAEDLVLNLCLHAVRHARREWYDDYAIKSVCDVAEVTRVVSIDWDLLASRALNWHADRPVFLVLALAREWLAAEIPAEAIESLRPRDFTPQVIEWAREQFFSPIQKVPRIGLHAVRFLGGQPLRRRLAILFRRLFPPLEELRMTYHLSPNTPWAWAYYPHRVYRIVVRDFSASVRTWRGDAQMAEVVSHAAHSRQFQRWLTAAPGPGADQARAR